MSATKTAPLAVMQTEEPSLLDQIVSRMSDVVHRAAPQVQPMELRSFDELERWAERAARSKMVPVAYQGKPDDIVLAVQMGSELGFRPMQSLQNIAVINGKPSVYGDAMLALCMTHPLYRSVQETIEGDGDARVAVCVVMRQGDAPKAVRFGVADARRAGLWDKSGPWKQYPDRMLQMRARGFALRDAFPDKLRGLISAEEAGDYQPMSAAPQSRPEPAEAPPAVDRIKDGADTLAARFADVVTAQQYYQVLDDEKVATQMRWLKANRETLFATVEAARVAAAERMQDAPADDDAPVYDLENAK